MSRSGHPASRKDRVSGGVLQILVGMMALALAASTLTGLAAAATALPDWSGTWQNQGPPVNTILFDGATSDPPGCDATYPPCREHPPYNAKWEARYLALNAKYVADTLPDPLIRCIPRGMPGDMRTPDAMEFVVRPERVWMFIENGNQARRIYTDGRGHRKGADAFHSFTGDSIGHWEGDTLVVDTVHLQGDLIIDRTGAILSNQAHIVERIRRRDAKTMQDDFTITDPGALTRPWKVTRLYKPINGEILDYACAENNRNPISGDGHTLAVGPHGEPLERTSKGKPNEK